MPSPEVFSATWLILPDFHVLIPKPDDSFLTVLTSLYDRLFVWMVGCASRLIAFHAALIRKLWHRVTKRHRLPLSIVTLKLL